MLLRNLLFGVGILYRYLFLSIGFNGPLVGAITVALCTMAR